MCLFRPLPTQVVLTATAGKRLLSTLRGEKPFFSREKSAHSLCPLVQLVQGGSGRLSWSKPG